MSLNIRISHQAEKDIDGLPTTVRRRVAEAIDAWASGQPADVRKLKGREKTYRLRVGGWRVLVVAGPDAGTLTVLRVLPRGSAYKRR